MHDVLLRWARRQGAGTTVALLCGEHAGPGPTGAVGVRLDACAATLPWALPFELLVAGVERVLFDPTGCQAPGALVERVASWAGLAETVGRPGTVWVAPDAPREGRVWDEVELPSIRRRGMMGLPDAAGSDQAPAGSDWVRLRTAARALAVAEASDGTGAEASEAAGDGAEVGRPGAGVALVAEGCTASGVCVETCLESALALIRTEGRASLRFAPSRCNGCGECVTACDARALKVVGALDWGVVLRDDVVDPPGPGAR